MEWLSCYGVCIIYGQIAMASKKSSRAVVKWASIAQTLWCMTLAQKVVSTALIVSTLLQRMGFVWCATLDYRLCRHPRAVGKLFGNPTGIVSNGAVKCFFFVCQLNELDPIRTAARLNGAHSHIIPAQSQYLIGILKHHVPASPRAGDSNSLTQPRIPLITGLERQMKPHSILGRISLLLVQTLEHFTLASPSPSGLQVGDSSIVRLQAVAGIQMRRLLVFVMIPHDLPVWWMLTRALQTKEKDKHTTTTRQDLTA